MMPSRLPVQLQIAEEIPGALSGLDEGRFAR